MLKITDKNKYKLVNAESVLTFQKHWYQWELEKIGKLDHGPYSSTDHLLVTSLSTLRLTSVIVLKKGVTCIL